MADYDVYAVKKDDDGNILLCFVSASIYEKFSTINDAKNYIRYHCTVLTKTEVMDDISRAKSVPFTRTIGKTSSKYEFSLGAMIRIVANKYLRSDANDTTEDNLDRILEIDD